MHYLIDTYNLLHASDSLGGSLAGLTVRRLCQHLAAAPAALKATLILDGRPKPDEPSPNEFPDFTLIYSGAGVKADTVIAQMVERSGNRKKLVIVSNDRAVALHARRHFATAISCENFLEGLTQSPNPSAAAAAKITPAQSPGEISRWLKEFGLSPDTDPNPQPLRPDDDDPSNLNIEDLLGPREN